jgi:hypothetical protein
MRHPDPDPDPDPDPSPDPTPGAAPPDGERREQARSGTLPSALPGGEPLLRQSGARPLSAHHLGMAGAGRHARDHSASARRHRERHARLYCHHRVDAHHAARHSAGRFAHAHCIHAIHHAPERRRDAHANHGGSDADRDADRNAPDSHTHRDAFLGRVIPPGALAGRDSRAYQPSALANGVDAPGAV